MIDRDFTDSKRQRMDRSLESSIILAFVHDR